AGPDSAGRGGAGQEGVGLLVYGSGIHWGTAYLGPDGRAPDSAGTLAVVPGPDAESPAGPEPALEPDPLTDLAATPEAAPEVVDFAAGQARQRMATRVLVPTRARRLARSARQADGGYPNEGLDAGEAPGLQADEQLVIIALALAFVAVAIIVGFLAHSLIVAV